MLSWVLCALWPLASSLHHADKHAAEASKGPCWVGLGGCVAFCLCLGRCMLGVVAIVGRLEDLALDPHIDTASTC